MTQKENIQKRATKLNEKSLGTALERKSHLSIFRQSLRLDIFEQMLAFVEKYLSSISSNQFFQTLPMNPLKLQISNLGSIDFYDHYELIQCQRFIIHLLMEKNKPEMNALMLKQIQKSPYFTQFLKFLNPSRGFGLEEEDQSLFYSYYISRNIEDLIKNMSIGTDQPQKQNFEQVFKTILRNTQTSKILNILKSKQKKSGGQPSKDRKISFFRTIIKHLKSTQRRRSKDSTEGRPQILSSIHKQLSNNTISKDQISNLVEEYGVEIINYLQTEKAYKDIINVNKSHRNKGYYLLHLKELSIIARNGKLSQYSFYLRDGLPQQIKKMAKVLFDEHKKNTKGQILQANIVNNENVSFSKNLQRVDSLQSFDFSFDSPQITNPPILKDHLNSYYKQQLGKVAQHTQPVLYSFEFSSMSDVLDLPDSQ